MKRIFNLFVAPAFLLTINTNTSVEAQSAYQSQGAPGAFGRQSKSTNNFRLTDSARTRNQKINLPQTGFGRTAGVFGPTGRNGLPVTSLDSFVLNAGGDAEMIYGDEGVDGLPPYFEFTVAHRINTGITGDRDAGLTTGHGSYLPDAWGGDEFVDGPEFSQSGSNGGRAAGGQQGNLTGGAGGAPNTGGTREGSDGSGITGGSQPQESGAREGAVRRYQESAGQGGFSVPTFGAGGFNVGSLF